ncbi:uncharacterized protein LOC129581737 [Paramacrobiotus metropolitanus]|uniref:uncharacterized protein LOC129581737 n=1 Tax=Paramacrobiotus metropolitanus TaxID=2943436 RepID=UPI0024465BBA|nr:uncharacterized protein LOC129581737 [Paramacrobiotus metropolitanus]
MATQTHAHATAVNAGDALAKTAQPCWTASFPVRAGDVLMRNEPWLYSLHPENFQDYCYRCFLPFSKEAPLDFEDLHKNGESNGGDRDHFNQNILCPGCGSVRYCSTDCQTADKSQQWRHGSECALLKSLRAKTIAPQHDLLLILKLIARLQNSKTDNKLKSPMLSNRKLSMARCDRRGGVPAASNHAAERDYARLVSHAEDILGSEVWMKDVQQLRQLLAMLLWEADVPDLRSLAEMYGKLKINSFDISDKHQRRLGEGVYLEGSQFDHACQRNAVTYFDGLTLVVKAVDDISDLSQVRLAYTEIFTTTAIRQQHLKKWYFFQCTCALCADPHKQAELECILCCTPACQRAIPLSFDFDHREEDACADCVNFVDHQLSLLEANNDATADADPGPSWSDFNWHDEIAQRMRLTRRLLAIDQRQHEKIHRFLNDESRMEPAEREKVLEEVEHRCRRMLETAELLLHPNNWMRCLTHNMLGKVLLASGNEGKRKEAAEAFALSLPGLRQGVCANDPRLGLQLLLSAVLPLTVSEWEENRPSDALSTVRTYAHEAKAIFATCAENDDLFYRIAESLCLLCERRQLHANGHGLTTERQEWLRKTLELLTSVVCRSLFPVIY